MNAVLVKVNERLSLYVRDTRELKGAFIQDRLIDRLEAVVWVILPIPFGHIGASVSCIRPVSCSDPPLICILLSDKVLLSGVADRHIASVHGKPGLGGLRSEVIMRCA